jgi:choline dehydrogenase-like flavoprotein
VPGGDGLPSASALGVHARLRAEVEALGKPSAVTELNRFLDVIESPVANLAMIGRPARFSGLSQTEREAYLRRWAVSPLAAQRKSFQVLKRLVLFYAYAAEASPYAAAAGYFPSPLDAPAEPPPLLLRHPRGGETIEADVCVIGSGAGGAVVAATIAATGKRVVILERAALRTESDFEAREVSGTSSLFYDRGLATTADRTIVLLAGSAVGGGTVVNWSTSLRLPAQVREEWRAAGIDDDLDTHYEAIERRLDVDTDESHRNGPNAALERGLAALELSHRTIPRAVRGCGDCGPCGVGCRRGAKQSTPRTYLADACLDGAELIDGCEARRIILRDGRVDTVVARTRAGHVAVRAPLIALAGGALLSPALLLRSDIGAPQAGRHLHLHPTTAVYGIYDEPVLPWRGVPQSVLGEAFADLERGYGFRLECPAALPGILAASLPWWGSDQHRVFMAEAGRVAPFIAIARDQEEGRIDIDGDGEPRVRYWPGSRDRHHLMRAIVETARVHIAAGARRVGTLHTPVLELAADGDLEAFVEEVETRGIEPHRVTLFSAHQMSTCRIGSTARESVANPDGEVWGVRGLYVTDASAFPSASGANPMLTVMALARRTAQRMLAAT